jgi:hypothetical protein
MRQPSSHRRPTSGWAKLNSVHPTAQVLSLALIVLLGGCPMDPAQATCEHAAATIGDELDVVGAFATTVGRIRAMEAVPIDPPRWPGLAPGHPATLCYLDGFVPHAPPGGDPFDRQAIAIVDGDIESIRAGYRDEMEVTPP